jgi:RimJ/RimL family protein N-acetyltransferase
MNFQLFGEQTERLVFKKLEPTDFSDCLRFFLDPRSNRYWKSDISSPLELANQWFAKQQWRYENNKGAINLLIQKQSNEIIGWCGLIVQTIDGKEELEVAYSIIPTHWKNGYATEAAKKCMECAFHNNWAESVISIIHVDNIESQRVAIKNGLAVDKRTIYHDNPVIIFRVLNKIS